MHNPFHSILIFSHSLTHSHMQKKVEEVLCLLIWMNTHWLNKLDSVTLTRWSLSHLICGLGVTHKYFLHPCAHTDRPRQSLKLSVGRWVGGCGWTPGKWRCGRGETRYFLFKKEEEEEDIRIGDKFCSEICTRKEVDMYCNKNIHTYIHMCVMDETICECP